MSHLQDFQLRIMVFGTRESVEKGSERDGPVLSNYRGPHATTCKPWYTIRIIVINIVIVVIIS